MKHVSPEPPAAGVWCPGAGQQEGGPGAVAEGPEWSVGVRPSLLEGNEAFRQVTSRSGLHLPIGPARCWLKPHLWGHVTQTLQTPRPRSEPPP